MSRGGWGGDFSLFPAPEVHVLPTPCAPEGRHCSSFNQPGFLLPPLPLGRCCHHLGSPFDRSPSVIPVHAPLPGSSLMSHRRFYWEIIHSTHLFTFLKSDFLLLLLSTFPGHLVTFCLDYCTHPWDFPGGPVARTLSFHCRGSQVPPLVGELRSHVPHGWKNPPQTITPILQSVVNVTCSKRKFLKPPWFFDALQNQVQTPCILNMLPRVITLPRTVLPWQASEAPLLGGLEQVPTLRAGLYFQPFPTPPPPWESKSFNFCLSLFSLNSLADGLFFSSSKLNSRILPSKG